MTPREEVGYGHSMSPPAYRTAIVTGASRGIGAATVRRLRRQGLAVHAIARSVEPLQALAEETGCIPLILDIADRAAVLAAFGAIEADVLVNNASPLVRSTPAWEASPEDIDALVDVNMRGVLHGLAATVPGMKARGRGHIVNLGSMAGTWIFPGMPVYAMTKAAIHSLSHTLRLDLHGSGIRVSEIAPGRVETGAHLALLEDRDEGRRRSTRATKACWPRTSPRPSPSCCRRRSAWT